MSAQQQLFFADPHVNKVQTQLSFIYSDDWFLRPRTLFLFIKISLRISFLRDLENEGSNFLSSRIICTSLVGMVM
jgi:hypothetical protein